MVESGFAPKSYKTYTCSLYRWADKERDGGWGEGAETPVGRQKERNGGEEVGRCFIDK